MLDLHQIALALGGEVAGGQVKAPGPGHSPTDHSLSVKLDNNAPDGFVVYSFAPGDDAIACKDYVRKKLGLPDFTPRKKSGNGASKPYSEITARYVYRDA